MGLPLHSVLAEPTRLAAIRVFADDDERCVGDLAHVLNSTHSRMSWQMQVLEQAEPVIRRDVHRARNRLVPDLPTNATRIPCAAIDVISEPERAAA